MIIITGASKNIGKFLLEKYNKSEIVFGTYLSSFPKETPLTSRYTKVDVSDYNAVLSFFNNIKNELQQITLINCAAISYNSFAHKSDPSLWKQVIDVNIVGTYNMIRAFLPTMREQNYGRIINISSVVAQKSTPGVSAYAASKSALWGLTKSLAAENGAKNITINNINLGYVKIGMGVEAVPEAYQNAIKDLIPSKEFCEPEDIFNTIQYIRHTSYLNGASIDLNGGLL
jgi:NAD(P)-dependent dehydrogenase (short-subunit alcohol dehydrogenase family)